MREITNVAEVQDYLMGHTKVLDFSHGAPLHKTHSTCSAVRRPLKELEITGEIADLSDKSKKITLPPKIRMF